MLRPPPREPSDPTWALGSGLLFLCAPVVLPSSGLCRPSVGQGILSAGCVGRQLHAASELGLRSGTLLAVPNPSPPPDTDALEAAVSQALEEAEAQGVGGKDVTPFLLARVTELTGGESLASNVELVLNNARTVSRLFLARLLCLGKDISLRVDSG